MGLYREFKELLPALTHIVTQLGDMLSSKCDLELKGSVKEPNKFHNYETEKITRKASDVAE